MKMTSAYANKLLKSLSDEKSYWTNKEEASRTYVAAVGEDPVIPEYDYSAVSDTLNEIDRKTVIIRHALNLANATAKIPVGDTEMSVDSILVKMAQLNYRKTTLDTMRKCLPKMRESSHSFSSRNAVPEYRYTNYDPELVKRDYERISGKIMEMQIALDQYNQTFLFEVEL